MNTYIHICWYQTPVLHSLFSNICCCFSFVRPHRWFQVISSGHGEWKLIDICSAEVAPVATTKTLRVRCFKSEPTIQVCKSFSYSIAFTQRNFGKLTSKLLFYSYSNAFPTCAWKKVFESTSSLYNSEPYIYIYFVPSKRNDWQAGKGKALEFARRELKFGVVLRSFGGFSPWKTSSHQIEKKKSCGLQPRWFQHEPEQHENLLLWQWQIYDFQQLMFRCFFCKMWHLFIKIPLTFHIVLCFIQHLPFVSIC